MLTIEEVNKILKAKMDEIRATKEFQERDWRQLRRDAKKLEQDLAKSRSHS